MDPTSVIDDAEFWLPPEFLTDEDFLVEKENQVDDSNKEYFGGFGSTFTPNLRFNEKVSDEEDLLVGLTRQMFQSSLEDDLSRGFCRNHAYPVCNDDKAWGVNRSSLCVAGSGCYCGNQRPNQNSQSRVSSQSWDLYCSAMEEVAKMNINDELYDYNNHTRGLLSAPRKVSSAVKNPNNGGSGYFNQHQSLPYQKLQAIHFQQLKQQQRIKHYRQLMQQSRGLRVNSNKNIGPVDLSTSAWSNQHLPRRNDGSGMRAVFLGNDTGKRGSTGTGVFLPRRVNHNENREKPTLSTVLVPARVAQVLNLNLDEPVRSSSASLNDVSWRQRSNNNGGFSSQIQSGVRVEQSMNEPRLPSEWAY